jgi:hypothetical protein
MSANHLAVDDLIRIPGGEFLMGQADGRDEERPVHRVTVAQFPHLPLSGDQRSLGGIPQGDRAGEAGVHARDGAGGIGELVRRGGVLQMAVGVVVDACAAAYGGGVGVGGARGRGAAELSLGTGGARV